MLKSISFKNGKALHCIAFSFLLSNASLEAAGTRVHWIPEADQILREVVAAVKTAAVAEAAAVAQVIVDFKAAKTAADVAAVVAAKAAADVAVAQFLVAFAAKTAADAADAADVADVADVEKLRTSINWGTAAELFNQKGKAILGPQFQSRTCVQCQNRWENILDPNINRRPWTAEDDQKLVTLHQEFGNRWTIIAARFRSRTAEQCRNRFVSLTTRQQRTAANRNRAVVAGAAGPALLPARLPAPPPAPRPESEEDGYGDPNAVDGEDDHCHLEFQHFVQCSISPTRTDDE
jgi:hypothetical protein